MGSLKICALSVVAIGIVGSANLRASDFSAPPQPIGDFGGWYLRGDIGMSSQTPKQLEQPLLLTASAFQWIDKGGLGNGPSLGIGTGAGVSPLPVAAVMTKY